MLRRSYMGALALLQVMLGWQLVPIIAAALQAHTRPGTAAEGWPLIGQVVCAALAVVGAGLALGYPSVMVMRHVQRGPQRFTGVPPWAVRVTFAGAALLLADGALRAASALVADADVRALAASLPLAPAGLALMNAGALLGEVLRRNRAVRARSLAEMRYEPVVRSTPDVAAALRRAA